MKYWRKDGLTEIIIDDLQLYSVQREVTTENKICGNCLYVHVIQIIQKIIYTNNTTNNTCK
jgi:hypothetical protein